MRDGSTPTIGWDDLDKGKLYAYSSSGLLFTRMLIYPPQVVKTRLQAQGSTGQYTGTWDAFKKIFQREGIRGLYRGVIPMSMGTLPTQMTYVTVLELLKARMGNLVGSQELDKGSWTAAFFRLGSNMMAGTVASACSSSLGVPIDVVVQRTQLHAASDASGNATNVARRLWASEGIRGFYRGFGASVLLYAPSSGVWWATYSNTRYLTHTYIEALNSYPIVRDSLSGLTAGLTTALFTCPLDVVKTRLQVHGESAASDTASTRSWIGVSKHLYKNHGVRGFYKGAVARMIGVAPTSALMITAYEYVKRAAAR